MDFKEFNGVNSGQKKCRVIATSIELSDVTNIIAVYSVARADHWTYNVTVFISSH